MIALNEFNLFSFSKRIDRPLILDGAMGSLLESKGLTSNDPSWSAKINLSHPDKVLKIHLDYIEAGADIITTNTFRTNPYSLNQIGVLDYKKFVKQAVNIAKDAVDKKNVLIAASNPPAEDCYQRQRKATKKELELNHCLHIETLYEYGSHFILNETQSHFDEIKIICEFCSKNRIPFVISLYFDEDLKILSGEKIQEVINFIIQYEPLSIGFNCITNSLLTLLLKNFNFNLNFNWGFYLNLFDHKKNDKNFYSFNFSYSQLIKDKINLKPSFIGACCGSSPEDIKSLKEFLDGRNYS